MARILNEPFSSALVVENPHPSLRQNLLDVGIESVWLDEVTTDDQLIEAINACGAQVLFKRSRVPVTEKVLAACPTLHAVQLCCIGDDSVDKKAAARHGVMVFNDPTSNGRSVVEMTLAHLLALSRRLYSTNDRAHENHWDKNNKGRYEVLGKTIGLLGLGNIGRQVARMCEALGMEVIFFDSRPVAREVGREMGWQPCANPAELFSRADYVSCHLSAKDAWGHSNAGMLDDVLPLLGSERPESSPRIFINLARGNLYAEKSLLDAVSSGAIRRAAVDVYPTEPAPGEDWYNPYAAEPNIVCTPHIGAATQEAQPRIASRVAQTIGRYSQLGLIRDCVYMPRFQLPVQPPEPGQAVLAVVHSTVAGTKKAVQDAIYEAGVSTLGSAHQDFPVGIAYDFSVLSEPVSEAALEGIVEHARSLIGDASAIRAVRQITVTGQER